MFAGHYNNVIAYPQNLPIVDSKTIVLAPKQIALRVGAYGEQLEHQTTSDGDNVRHVVVYHPRSRSMPEAGATSLLDHDPRIVISTFESYEQLGRSYWSAVEAKTKPTAEISKLAEQITAGITDKRAQAEAIDHWIKQNIRYVGVYLGTGRVVANDPMTVLTNKYGDCKDHATLMMALLAAKGIASEQVLINLGDVYTVPEIVSPNYFNHAMIYLPEFGLYDDPTANFAAFGVLAQQAYDKPVLRVSAQGAKVARTPAMKPAEHVTTVRTRFAIASDGVVTGETLNSATGARAVELRSAAMKIQAAGAETGAELLLKFNGNPGKGRFEIASPVDGKPQYTINGKFMLNVRFSPSPGMSVTVPRGTDVFSPGRPGELLFGARLQGRTMPFMCSAGRQIEDIEVSFADGLPLPLPPKGIKIERPLLAYTSDYRVENRTLKIHREFESRVSGEVCDPQVEAAIADPLRAVQADLATVMSFPTATAKIDLPKLDLPKNELAKTEPPKPAQADTQLAIRNQCAGLDNPAADLRIGACTALIQSGKETQTSLAVDFVNRGVAYRMKGDNARAVAEFDQAIKLVGNFAAPYNLRGLARASLRDFDGAIADFSKAIELNPTLAVAYANRGNGYWIKGDRAAAMADFHQAAALDPANVYVFQSRGVAYRIAGDFDRAIADFDQAIRVQKSNAAAWNERCYARLLGRSALSAVLADCDEAVRLDPKFAPAFANRALALLSHDEFDRAVADYDAALRLNPKYAAALYGRGLAKLKMGDKDAGNADVAAATELDANAAQEFAKFNLTVAANNNAAKPAL